ncbi:MAG: cbb3-type cytochrome c oxidase subunit 3 [Proteobacteria bacterium]|nr:cbb3-type cytochrome c oxidase subunit 3 [Pseudomonadota bacterium]
MIGLIQLMQWASHYSIVIMMLVFVAIVIGAYWPTRKAEMERRGRIPLEDDV